LKECGHRIRRIILHDSFKLSDVYSELHRNRGASDRVNLIVLHLRLGVLAQCGGQIAVVDKKNIRLATSI
jgi:hypothetical protein